MDFVRVRRPDLDGRQLMWIGRATTAGFMVFAAAWATQIEKFGSLFGYLQHVLSYLAPPAVAVFVLGVFWRRAGATGAFASLLTGLGLGVGMLVLNLTVWEQGLHFLYVGTLLFVICLLVHVGVSLATAGPPAQQVTPLMWTRQDFARESEDLARGPWHASYRVWAAALLAVTALVVAGFW
jgi:SSS family solute:Na+ symporter